MGIRFAVEFDRIPKGAELMHKYSLEYDEGVKSVYTLGNKYTRFKLK